jgi:hypothetical protein
MEYLTIQYMLLVMKTMSRVVLRLMMWIGIEEGIDGQFLITVNDLLNLISVHCPIPNNYTESLFRLHFPGKI